MALDTNQQEESYRPAGQFYIAQNDGLLTDANVAAADTVAGLRTAVTNAVASAVNASEMNRQRTLRAITTGVDAGILTDAAILPLTTVAGLIALFNLPTGYKSRAFYE
jgi:hypothetical protein